MRKKENVVKLCRKGSTDIMLLKFKFSNFSCFADEAEINFYANEEIPKSDTVKTILKNDINILRKCAIFGGNSTGKSYAIKALSVFLTTIAYGHIQYGKEAWEFLKTSIPFAFNTKNKFIPSFFEVELLIKGNVYRYGVKTLRDKIVSEYLYQINNKESIKIFNNVYYNYNLVNKKLEFEYKPIIDTGDYGIKNDQDILTFTKTQFNESEYSFLFRLSLSNWDIAQSIREYVLTTTYFTAKPVDDDYFDSVNTFIRKKCADDELLYHLKEFDRTIEKINITPVFEDDKDTLIDYNIFFMRKMKDHKKLFGVNYIWESKGTRKFFLLLLDAMIVFKYGGALLIDEYDSNLHPNAQLYFIKLFESKYNLKKAQLILNSQNTTLLRSAYFRPDELYLTDRGIYGEASLQSILSFYDKSEYNDLLTINYEDEYNSGAYVSLQHFNK